MILTKSHGFQQLSSANLSTLQHQVNLAMRMESIFLPCLQTGHPGQCRWHICQTSKLFSPHDDGWAVEWTVSHFLPPKKILLDGIHFYLVNTWSNSTQKHKNNSHGRYSIEFIVDIELACLWESSWTDTSLILHRNLLREIRLNSEKQKGI